MSGFGQDLFCAADQSREVGGSCKGDSGGPIFTFNTALDKVHFELNGIVNGGERCGRFNTPDIYTSTTFAPIYEWIREKVECSEGQKCLIRQKCPEIQEKYDEIQSIFIESDVKRKLTNELRKSVCDKKEKLFCCTGKT